MQIDAALDESNQAVVAALLTVRPCCIACFVSDTRGSKQHVPASMPVLLQGLASSDGSCQILCVTHNQAFQQHCSSLFQVSVRAIHWLLLSRMLALAS